MTPDPFESALDSLIAPSRNCFPITPHDSQTLPHLPKAIYIGTGGSIVLRAVDSDQDVAFVNLTNGSVIDVRAKIVRATGTTASNLVGLG